LHREPSGVPLQFRYRPHANLPRAEPAGGIRPAKRKGSGNRRSLSAEFIDAN
jgi:hypothetical protein